MNLQGREVHFELSPHKTKGGKLKFKDTDNGNSYELLIEPEHVAVMKDFVQGLVNEVATGMSTVVKRFASGQQEE